jgi:hypothetical protein
VKHLKRIAAIAVLPLVGLGFAGCGALPRAPITRVEPPTPEEAAIERQELCVGSSVASAGKLADTLYYRWARTPEGQLAVGYFVFYSQERPWGNNWMTWTVLPALFVDMVYSHSLLLGPGYQAFTKGKGDVEGVSVFYNVRGDGTLAVDHALADDGHHDNVLLSKADLFAVDPGHPTVYSDVWSHQLGARNATSLRDLAYDRCYSAGQIRPLPDEVAAEFNVDGRGRAEPAHVEAMFGAPKARQFAKETAASR